MVNNNNNNKISIKKNKDFLDSYNKNFDEEFLVSKNLFNN